MGTIGTGKRPGIENKRLCPKKNIVLSQPKDLCLTRLVEKSKPTKTVSKSGKTFDGRSHNSAGFPCICTHFNLY